jgi:Ca2+-binding EF-hand superfamily protein
LDPELTGFVAWRTMFTYLALLNSAIPNESDIATLKKAVKQTNGLVSYDDFVIA